MENEGGGKGGRERKREIEREGGGRERGRGREKGHCSRWCDTLPPTKFHFWSGHNDVHEEKDVRVLKREREKE